jgi:EmrB/QacA subfamily drug resistance transporter
MAAGLAAQPPSGPGGVQAEDRIGWPVWRLAWVIVFGAFASGLDTSLVNVGLDTIARDLGSGLPVAQWAATGYLLALAMSLPLAGWLGRRIGVGRLWLAALAAFTTASVLCALAPSIEILIGLRVVQGLAGGLLVPAGQTVLGQAVGARRLGRVMATLGVAVSVAPALGPVIGGLILHVTSWRWLFAINLPVGALGLVLGTRYIPRGTVSAGAPLDWRALIYVSAGLPLIVYGLTGNSPAEVVLPLTAGVCALAAFTVRSRRNPRPLLDLGLFRNRVFAAATAASAITGMMLFGSGLLMPLYLQIGRHDSVVASGVHLLALGGATAAVLPLTGRLVDRYGGGIVAVIGTALTTVATVPFAVLPVNANPALVYGLLALLGGAIALAAVPAGIAAYKAADPGKLADATTTVNIAQRLGGALGGAIFTLLLTGIGFHAAFWAMTAAGAAALIAAMCLTMTSRAAVKK